MSEYWLHAISSLLIILGLAVIVIGLQGTALVWQAGLGIVATALLVSLATRWLGERKEGEGLGARDEGDGT